ncbi:MAG: hypothetical protein K0S08_1510 [Gammaproteobacteria bacterium]|jgi:hypothetical protein|nr:hypothetical protein [Gammaproteobacteria bacterium]
MLGLAPLAAMADKVVAARDSAGVIIPLNGPLGEHTGVIYYNKAGKLMVAVPKRSDDAQLARIMGEKLRSYRVASDKITLLISPQMVKVKGEEEKFAAYPNVLDIQIDQKVADRLKQGLSSVITLVNSEGVRVQREEGQYFTIRPDNGGKFTLRMELGKQDSVEAALAQLDATR